MSLELQGFRPQSAATAALLALVDDVRIDPAFHACSVAFEKTKLVLRLGQPWARARDDHDREMLLRHEATHVTNRHWWRQGSRDALILTPRGPVGLFYLCCDAPIHEFPGWIDRDAFEFCLGGPMVTYERLGLPPCPPEVAYDLLLSKATLVAGIGCVGCGSGGHEPDEAVVNRAMPRLLDLHDAVTRDLAEAASRDATVSPGRPAIGTLPEPEPWLRELADRLRDHEESHLTGESDRTWRREHRQQGFLLPGRRPSRAWSALFVVDASGSISEPQLEKCLATLTSVPELAASCVRVFSGWLGPSIPADDMMALKAEIARHGGSTLIQAAARAIPDHEAGVVVWITDADSQDGLPGARAGWHWAITRAGKPTRVMADPRES